MALIERLLAGKIRHGTLRIERADGSISELGNRQAGWPDIILRIHNAAAERRILLNPRLGLGDAYIDGSVSVGDDDIMGLIELVRRNNPWEKGGEIGDSGMLKRLASQLVRPLRQMNNLARSRANVAHHYDLSNDFYKLWLDSDMQYSCAYWPDQNIDLEAAQSAKKAHIAGKLA